MFWIDRLVTSPALDRRALVHPALPGSALGVVLSVVASLLSSSSLLVSRSLVLVAASALPVSNAWTVETYSRCHRRCLSWCVAAMGAGRACRGRACRGRGGLRCRAPCVRAARRACSSACVQPCVRAARRACASWCAWCAWCRAPGLAVVGVRLGADGVPVADGGGRGRGDGLVGRGRRAGRRDGAGLPGEAGRPGVAWPG